MFPRLMAGAQQIKRRIPPIEMGGAARGAAQGAAPLSAYIEGSGPGLALPNSFLINVTGTMDTSSITVKLGNALTDIPRGARRHRHHLLAIDGRAGSAVHLVSPEISEGTELHRKFRGR